MYGLPSETKEDIEASLALIEEIDPPFVSIARYTPMPGSELYESLVKNGEIHEGEIDWAQWGNQWLHKSFARAMRQEESQEIIQQVARRIDERNRQRQSKNPHPLLCM